MKSRPFASLPVTAARTPLAAAIAALSGIDRLVLALRLLDGLSPLETASALGIGVAEVASRWESAMESLGRELRAQASLRRAA